MTSESTMLLPTLTHKSQRDPAVFQTLESAFANWCRTTCFARS